MYIIDTSVISALHKNYYRSRFPSLWEKFDALIDDGQFASVREVLRELDDRGGDSFDWAKVNSNLFTIPNAKEGFFIASIYAVEHFQANIEKQKLLRGGHNADPFLIARAACLGGIVLTMEQFKPNGAKIPNICKHFNVACLDLRGFMEKENWIF
ncbi:PIN domain-containing protein [Undibacterium sp. Ji83W]|uniref:PIN domain-containing protein n=1 Tax=Undibacterium sp. Ji83W TaxID=3413043 RepID=UPI003BF1F371